MIPIPKKIRKAQEADPEFQGCMLRAYPPHICGGRPNTREHALIVAGKRLQAPWAIISACARGHEVDEFQDAGTMDKDLNKWVALNRATDAELRAISKAVDYIREKGRLNEFYGEYVPYVAQQSDSGINYGYVDKPGDNLGNDWRQPVKRLGVV